MVMDVLHSVVGMSCSVCPGPVNVPVVLRYSSTMLSCRVLQVVQVRVLVAMGLLTWMLVV